MTSIFTDKEVTPSIAALKNALGDTYKEWKSLADFTCNAYQKATEAWHYTSAKYGWSFRISDNKRVIVYLLPRDKFFKVSMVFGRKAFGKILKSNINEAIKTELSNATVYAEGRCIRIDVKDSTPLNDIEQLIKIKINN